MGKDALSGRYLFWIDPDMLNQSYCSPQLTQHIEHRQLQLRVAEVWALEIGG